MSRLRTPRLAIALAAVVSALVVVAPPRGAGAAPAPVVTTVTGYVVLVGPPPRHGVRGVRVTAYDAGETDVLGADLTDRAGRFEIRVRGDHEEFGIYVRGARVGVQNGWAACNHTVVPTFGEACTLGADVKEIRVKKLS